MFLGLFKRKPKMVKVKKKNAPKRVSKVRKTKKTKTKRVTTKKAVVKKKTTPKIVGEVTHYFPHVKAGVIKVTGGKVVIGDTLQIKGHTTDLKQKVKSMQIDNVPIKQAKPGQEIGLLVNKRVRQHDTVYKL